MRRAIVLANIFVAGSIVCAFAGERVTNPRALVVRGVNGGTCDAAGIGAGSDPKVGVNTEVQNLSVNCSPDGKTAINSLRTTIPNPHICWAKLEDLEKRNANIMVVTDRVIGNEYHCLVSDITPNQMVKALHYRP